jgi:hypothetical protein
MKRLVVLSAVFCLLSIAAFGQAKPADYSGEWSLDKAKSTLSDRMKTIESMTMTVTQTDKDLKVATATKRGAPPAGAGGPGGGTGGGAPGAGGPPPGGGGPGGGGGRGGGGMGDQTLTYTLDGKETSTEVPGFGGGTSTLKSTAKIDGGKLNLTTARSTQMGDIKTSETWEIQSDGMLKIKRTTESPRGSETNDLVFTKKPAAAAAVK